MGPKIFQPLATVSLYGNNYQGGTFFFIYVGGSYRTWGLSEGYMFDLVHLLTARTKYCCQSTYFRTKL